MPTKGRTFQKEGTEYVTCPKCGRPAWKPRRVKLKGKGGVEYWYLRYRHPLFRRKKEEHYVREEAPKEPKKAGVHRAKLPSTREDLDLEAAVAAVEAKRKKAA